MNRIQTNKSGSVRGGGGVEVEGEEGEGKGWREAEVWGRVEE